MRIKYKKKKRKTRRLYGQKYRGFGQVGRHRHHPGGRGMAGSKDHMKIYLTMQGYEFGSGKGFVRHGLKREYTEINIDRLFDFAKSEGLETKKENGKIVIDLRSYKYIKILGRGKITVPLKIILNSTARISDIAKEKIENSGGEIVIVE